MEFLIFRGVKNGSKSNPLGTQGMAIFFRGCIGVKLGFGCDNTKCSFKLELGWVLTTRAELSTFPQPNHLTLTDTVVFGTFAS